MWAVMWQSPVHHLLVVGPSALPWSPRRRSETWIRLWRSNKASLASSSPVVRRWTAGIERVHHIIDPSTGYSVAPFWNLVSVAGASCVDANALSTAAVVWGPEALDRLRPFGQAARLLRHDGEVFTVGGWPS